MLWLVDAPGLIELNIKLSRYQLLAKRSGMETLAWLPVDQQGYEEHGNGHGTADHILGADHTGSI